MNKLQIPSAFAALAVVSAVFLPAQAPAQLLPGMDDGHWIGVFSGYVRKGFEFGLDNEGQCHIYLLDDKDGERASRNKVVKIYTELLVESEDGKLSTKRLKDEEGFATEMKAGLDHKEVKFTAETTGDAKVEIHIKYDRDRIIFDGNIIDRGSFKTEKLYLSFKVSPGGMYGQHYNNADEKKLKSVMRKDKVRFVRAEDKKRVSLKTYEEVDLREDQLAKGGVTLVSVDMSCQEGNEIIYTTLDGSGVFEFDNRSGEKKGYLYKGYVVRWKKPMVDNTKAKESKAKSNSRRASDKKTYSPLVIELK